MGSIRCAVSVACDETQFGELGHGANRPSATPNSAGFREKILITGNIVAGIAYRLVCSAAGKKSAAAASPWFRENRTLVRVPAGMLRGGTAKVYSPNRDPAITFANLQIGRTSVLAVVSSVKTSVHLPGQCHINGAGITGATRGFRDHCALSSSLGLSADSCHPLKLAGFSEYDKRARSRGANTKRSIKSAATEPASRLVLTKNKTRRFARRPLIDMAA